MKDLSSGHRREYWQLWLMRKDCLTPKWQPLAKSLILLQRYLHRIPRSLFIYTDANDSVVRLTATGTATATATGFSAIDHFFTRTGRLVFFIKVMDICMMDLISRLMYTTSYDIY